MIAAGFRALKRTLGWVLNRPDGKVTAFLSGTSVTLHEVNVRFQGPFFLKRTLVVVVLTST
jgi:acylphosphatase